MGPDTLLPSAPRQQRGHSRTFPTRREASRRLGVRPAAATWLPARIADAKRCQSRKSDGKDGRTAAVAGYLRGIASAASEIRRRRALPRKFLTATGSAASLTSAFRRASDLPSALLTATGVRLRLSAGFPAGVPPPRAFLTATEASPLRACARSPKQRVHRVQRVISIGPKSVASVGFVFPHPNRAHISIGPKSVVSARRKAPPVSVGYAETGAREE